jgi:predicted nucleic acid-binding protein
VTAKVVDASALAAVLFSEPEFEKTLARLDGMTLFAPSLLPYEIANVCAKKTKLHPANAALFLGALTRFASMTIDLRDVDARDIFQIVQKSGLSAYDASYLWLARELGVELVTLDGDLDKAFASQ